MIYEMGELYGDRAAPQLAGINLRQKLLNAASFRPNFPALFASLHPPLCSRFPKTRRQLRARKMSVACASA